MIIYNTDTNQEIEISYCMGSNNQTDCSLDIMGGYPQLKYNKEEERHEADQDTIDYWQNWFEKSTTADDLERDLKEIEREKKIGWISDVLEEINNEAGHSDFTENPNIRIKVYKDLYKEIQDWQGEMGYEKVSGYWRFEQESNHSL